MTLWLLTIAFAQVQPVVLPLLPGVPTEVEVVSVDSPNLVVTGASVRAPQLVVEGLWRVQLLPNSDAQEVVLSLSGKPSRFEVALPEESSITAPERVESMVGGKSISFAARGACAPSEIEAFSSEGVVEVLAEEDGIRVRFSPESSLFPRVVPVVLRCQGSTRRPSLTVVRLRARPRLPLKAEPGASVSLIVGGRDYGPFDADDSGLIVARVDQYPGERVAKAIFRDDLGNTTHADLPLPGQLRSTVLVVASDGLIPKEQPKPAFVFTLDGRGNPMKQAPTCNSPLGLSDVVEVESGLWMVPIPALEPLVDVPLVCQVGQNTESRIRVEVSPIPVAVQLRAWPTKLSTEFPLAEVQVVLEDLRGNRLPTDGITVSARQGALQRTGEGLVLRADYDGSDVEGMSDEIIAEFRRKATNGSVAFLQLGHGVVTSMGPRRLSVRAYNSKYEPLVNERVVLYIGAEEYTVHTTSDGWADVEVELRGESPWVVSAVAGDVQRHGILLAGMPSFGGEGSAELRTTHQIELIPGRTRGVSVAIEPPVLKASPGAVAIVAVVLEDGAGQPITDETPVLSVSEGTLSTPVLRADGSWQAEYTPGPVLSSIDVEVTASTETINSTAHLRVDPRTIRVGVGPWVGYQTNFGSVSSPVFGMDLDLRIRSRWTAEAAQVRLGVFGYNLGGDVILERGGKATIRATVVPVYGALLLRDDFGPLGLWFGGGGAVSWLREEVAMPGALMIGSRALPGPVVVGGAGYRLLGGEAFFTVKGLWAVGTPTEVGYRGNVGGLALGAGYRVAF